MRLRSLRQNERTTAKDPAGYNTRDKLIRAIERSMRNINKDGRADGIRRLPNIWQKVINKGVQYWGYTNVVPLWMKPCQKYQTVSITFHPTFLFIYTRCRITIKCSKFTNSSFSILWLNSSLELGFPCKCMFLYKLVTLLKLCKYSFYDLTIPNRHTFSVRVCIFWPFGE